jgi:hypothetical protein
MDRVEPGQGSLDVQKLIGQIIGGPIAKTIVLVLLIYPVGYASLWVQFQWFYNTDSPTSWYAVSLVPRSVVIIEGVEAIVVPFLFILVGAMAASLIHYIPRVALRRANPKAALGTPKFASIVLFVVILALACWRTFHVEWPRGIFQALALISGAVTLEIGIRNARRSNGKLNTSQIVRLLSGLYVALVFAVILDIGVLVTLLERQGVLLPSKRPLPFAELVLKDSYDPITQGDQPELVRMALTCPEEKRCAVGSLVAKKDGYWYLFSQVQDGYPLTLQAIPEGDVTLVTSFRSKERTRDRRDLNLTLSFPPIEIVCHSGEIPTLNDCGRLVAPPELSTPSPAR